MLYSQVQILAWLGAYRRDTEKAVALMGGNHALPLDRANFAIDVIDAMIDAVRSGKAFPAQPPPAEATDLQRAQYAISGALRREGWLAELEGAVGRAQNGPPLGAADGSLSEEQWYRARAILLAAKALRAALSEWREADGPARYERIKCGTFDGVDIPPEIRERMDRDREAAQR